MYKTKNDLKSSASQRSLKSNSSSSRINQFLSEIESIYGYKMKKLIGKGSYGGVYKVKCQKSGIYYALKVFNYPFKSGYLARQTYREIKIMRYLSEMKENIFIPKLVEIILPSLTLHAINQSNI